MNLLMTLSDTLGQLEMHTSDSVKLNVTMHEPMHYELPPEVHI